MLPELIVVRAALDLADPWTAPPTAAHAMLHLATTGAAPRLTTVVTPYHDGKNLHCLFSAEDDHIVASHRERDAPVWQEDAFELFLAPRRLERYFEFEASPTGTLFDARVESDDRRRATMRVDPSWNAEGLQVMIRKEFGEEGRIQLDVLLSIPFAALDEAPPQPGVRWRANFFRIDRHPEGDFYAAWSPTLRDPADFHLPESFGTLHFA